jgi:hypothetical protein
MNDL